MMAGQRQTRAVWRCHFGALSPETPLLAGALICALFFNGVFLPAYAASLILLVVATALALWPRGARLAELARSPMLVALALWWAWLGLTVLWSPARFVSSVEFWWKGAMVLAFVAVAGSAHLPWRQLLRGVVLVGLVLAALGAVQALVLGQPPHSLFLNPNSHAAFLNLVALALVGRTLALPAAERTRAALLGAAVFFLVFGMALVGGRGALLSLLLAALLPLWLGARRVGPGRAAAVGAILAVAVLVADLVRGGYVAGRLATLVSPASAGYDRFPIWEASLRLLADTPWWGAGAGTFWLLYPSYRLPADGSGGYYAHNDYLQLLIEAGVPGLLLTLAVLGVMVWRVYRRQRGPDSSATEVLEAAGLAAGILVVALHSLFTFNFYILPTLIVVGAFLGRLEHLAPSVPARRAVGEPARRRLHWALAAVAALSLASLLATAASHAALGRALERASAGEPLAADAWLRWARRLEPSADAPLLARARLYLSAARADRALPAATRADLLRAALAALEGAVERNALRAETHYLHGQVLALERPRQPLAAQQSFARALALDPLHLGARAEVAGAHLRAGERELAAAALSEGLAYRHPPRAEVVAFLVYAARVFRDLGETDEAELAARLADEYRESVRASVNLLEDREARP